MSRKTLAYRRACETIRHVRPVDQRHFCKIMPEYTISIGRFPDGRIAEVFVSSSRSSSELAAVVRDASVILSIAFQFGAPVEILRRGVTRNSAGAAASIIGEVLDILAGGDEPCAAPPAFDPIAPAPAFTAAL